jgi:predicted component of type VI protein secretion system
MGSARLHYRSHDIAVSNGTFVIGRGIDCQLALDDPMVSRRHACLHIDDTGARLEDLGSRNGVFLNGVKVDKIEKLSDGDLIRIGSQDLAFYSEDMHPASSRRALRETRRDLPRMRPTMAEVPMSAAMLQGGTTSPGSVPPPSAPPSKPAPASGMPVPPSPAVRLEQFDDEDPSEQTFVSTGPMAAIPGSSASGLAIIGSVADKALALGRADEAERILSRSLFDILNRAQKGGLDGGPPSSRGPKSGPKSGPKAGPPSDRPVGVTAEVAERAASYALRLASATGRGHWVDYLFQLYTALAVLMPAKVVDELYAAVRKVKSTDKNVSRAYCQRLRESAQNFGPAERFVLQRIEGLERWAP